MIVTIIILFSIVLYLLVSFIFFNILCKRLKGGKSLEVDKEMLNAIQNNQEQLQKGLAWLDEQASEPIMIKANDGIRLRGTYIEHPSSNRIMLLVHGYRSDSRKDIGSSASMYYELGFNLLLIDQRACGKSDGTYITFGAKESDDVLCWIDYLKEQFPKKSICLGGVSLGATTVLMTASKTDDITHVIADCAYVDAKEEILYASKHFFKVNVSLFYPAIWLYCKLIADFDIAEINTVKALRRTKTPILWIHGSDDAYVLPENSQENFDKYKGTKQLEIFDGAIHGMSLWKDKERYINTIKTFLNA